MSETAAHLVDSVLPQRPIRQWVMTFPIPLRPLLAIRPKVMARCLEITTSAINDYYRKKAGFKKPQSKTGPVTVPPKAPTEVQVLTLQQQLLEKKKKTQRVSWARLLKRVFNIDVETCGACGEKMRIIAAVEDPQVIKKILDHLGRNEPESLGTLIWNTYH